MDFLHRHFLTGTFLRFLLLGCFNTFSGTALATLFRAAFPVNIAFCIAYLVSNILAYGINCAWVFRAKGNLSGYLKFAASYLPNFLVQNMVVFLCYNLLGLPEIAAFLLAAILGIPITFLAVKCFAFGR